MRKLFLSVIGFAALTASTAFAQDGARVSGRVVGETGAPLVGASVFIPGMSLGSTTADDGSYSFVVPASRANGQTATLTARILGYTPTSVQIALTSGCPDTDVTFYPREPRRPDGRSGPPRSAMQHHSPRLPGRTPSRSPLVASV